MHGVRVQLLFTSAHRDSTAVSNLSAEISPHSGERGYWVLGTNNSMSCAGIEATQLMKKNTRTSLHVLSETAKRGIKQNQNNVCHGTEDVSVSLLGVSALCEFSVEMPSNGLKFGNRHEAVG